jgi:alpha/beta superfamily hydrolase
MPRRIETLFLNGPAGRLEAIIEEPEEGAPAEAALVLHPHPQHGGTMHNKVVYRLARGLRKAGCAVLRFNFRGVNLSEGEYGHSVGETEDARAALAELRRRYPGVTLLVAGFSFGSRIALRLAFEDPGVARVLAAGFPTVYPDREYVYDVHIPKYFVQSTCDAFGPKVEMQPFFESLPEPKQIEWIASADHFFRDNLDGLEQAVVKIGLERQRLAG